MPRKVFTNSRGISRQAIPGQPPDHAADFALNAVNKGLNILSGAVNQMQNYPFSTPNIVRLNYTCTPQDVSVWAIGSGISVTLLSALNLPIGYSLFVKNANPGATNVTVLPAGADTLAGASSVTLLGPGNTTCAAWFTVIAPSAWGVNYYSG